MKLTEEVAKLVSEILAKKEGVGGIANVVWVAAGGSNGGNYPAQYFMEHESTQVVSHAYTRPSRRLAWRSPLVPRRWPYMLTSPV